MTPVPFVMPLQLGEIEEQLKDQTAILESVLDNMSEGVLVSNVEGRLVDSNKAARQILGGGIVPKLSEWPARYGLFLPDGITPFPANQLPLARALRGLASDNVHVLVSRPGAQDGQDSIWLSVSARPLRDDFGKTSGAVSVFRNITEIKRTQEALKARAEELERSNKELEQFAYVASHDLQEPLRMISSYTQLLSRRYTGKLDKDADEFIAYAVDGAVRMQQLINDLLAYSRVGTRAGEMRPVSSEAVVSKALANLQAAIMESQAVVSCDELPMVEADPVQLGQLFQNLIGNAIKFRNAEPPEIRVEVEELGESYRFSVKDNGIGIDPQYAERIFQVFQRLHTKQQYPGTGIGLAICKKIVERHGGTIVVESQPGHGAAFRFTIPKAKEATNEQS